MSIGIKGIGVPWGKKWAKEDLVLWRKPRITVPAHNGIAIPRFIDSCVVGVNECGRRPSKFVEPMNMIREISISDQVRPFSLCIIISCFNTSWTSQCWNEIKRLLISRWGEGNKMLGIRIMIITIGRPIILGVIKGANKFSFTCFLKVGNALDARNVWFWVRVYMCD